MAKSKVTIKNLDRVIKNVQKIFDDSIKSEAFLIKVRDFAVLRIKAETRKGKDLSRNGAPQPGLAPFTQIIRANVQSGRWKIKPKSGRPFFRANLSNLTMTGQLLDSVVGNMRARLGHIEITVHGDREETELYSAKTGKLIQFKNQDEITTNKGLARKLADEGRTFLGLDDKGVQRIRKMALDEIRRKIKQSRFVAKP